MTPGTIIKLPDGREGTVVYHGLDGYGIQWGRVDVDTEALASTLLSDKPPADWPWFPEAMLRDEYPSAELPCVGDDYEIIQTGKESNDGEQARKEGGREDER